MQTIAVASVLLSKTDGLNHTSSHSLHYRSNVNENEMIGIATKAALEMKPGFSVHSVLVDMIELPDYPPCESPS